MTYRELQQALKALRDSGTKLEVRLNASFSVLSQEYARLTNTTVEKTVSEAAQDKAVRESRVMTYRELQAKLKVLKSEGKTSIKLNHKYEVLLTEYNRLTAAQENAAPQEVAA